MFLIKWWWMLFIGPTIFGLIACWLSILMGFLPWLVWSTSMKLDYSCFSSSPIILHLVHCMRAFVHFQKRYRAVYDYAAADEDEVSFLDGDVIVDVQPIDEGWMYGRVERTGQQGMLPANYVEAIWESKQERDRGRWRERERERWREMDKGRPCAISYFKSYFLFLVLCFLINAPMPITHAKHMHKMHSHS